MRRALRGGSGSPPPLENCEIALEIGRGELCFMVNVCMLLCSDFLMSY